MTGWDLEGNYHRDGLLEQFDLSDAKRQRVEPVVRVIMQSIIAESPYAPDIEWQLWHQANELESNDMLPANITAYDVHQYYLRVFEGE